MWADILTKPLQGQKFKDMRAFLLNCARDYDDNNKKKLSMKPQDVASSRECVGAHARNPPARPPSPTCVSQIDAVMFEYQVGPNSAHRPEDVQTKKNKGTSGPRNSSQPSDIRGKLQAK
jgi:hypothetical protein